MSRRGLGAPPSFGSPLDDLLGEDPPLETPKAPRPKRKAKAKPETKPKPNATKAKAAKAKDTAGQDAPRQATRPKTAAAGRQPPEGTTRTSFNLPADLLRAAKIAAVEDGRTLVSIVVEALEDWMTRRGERP